MTQLKITKVTNTKPIPDPNTLVFGHSFSDHMFIMDYETGKGWHDPRIVPYGEIPIFPSAMVLHYGQAIFEGMKAFRKENGDIVIFRPKDYLARFNRSAQIMCIPQLDIDIIQSYLAKLIDLEKNWVPNKVGTSLYIRPFIISTDPYVGVKVADQYKLMIILAPVGAYYAEGFNPVSIKVEDNYVRAVQGGLGEAKTPANYAASLRAQEEAKKEGFSQVLWLDGVNRKFIEEVGTMNIFFKINGEIITPALNGSILGGITRKTVLEVTRKWGMKVSEREISIEEVYAAYEKGQLEEVFGSGTAAVISPVGELSWKGRKMTINNNKTGEISQKLFDYITGMQYGKVPDEFGWVEKVAKV